MQGVSLPDKKSRLFDPPRWANATQAMHRFGLSRYELAKLDIKSVKLGPERQARRLFSVADIEAKLAELSLAKPGRDAQ